VVDAELGDGDLDLSGGHASGLHGLLQGFGSETGKKVLESSVGLVQVGRQKDHHGDLVALVGKLQEMSAKVLRDG